MKRLIIFVVLLSLLVGLVGCHQSHFQPGTYTDDMGRAISIKKSPERIVSHVPAITEILFALGLGDKVVGVSDFCDYPEEAKTKRSVGNYFDPSIERIVALNPDLVLTDGHSEGVKQLDSLGIAFLVIDPKDFDGIFRDIELIGQATGTEARAKKLVDQMKADVARITNQVKGAQKVKAFYVIDATDLNNPWTAGPGSFVDSLINMAGGENVAAKAVAPWVQFSIEQVVNADPEVIILPAKHGTAFTMPQELQGHPAWRQTTAVKQGRIHTIDSDLVDRSGPRIVQGLEEIAKILHPELFE
jgi:iron complex transport system substrate-binding protein